MSEAATDLAPIEPRKAITVTVAERYGMEADAFELALRNTVFLEGNRAEYAAFLVVCNEYKLNPLTKEIYAFKNKAGKVVPVVSIDGWVSLCNGHHAFDGMTFEDHHDEDGKLVSIKCTIFRKDRSRPTEVTEYLSECARNTDPWKMQHRMLRHKSLIQCARYAFGFSGIYDQEEAEEVVGVEIVREPTAALTSGFGADKPARAPRKPKATPASDQAGEPEEGPHASQEAQERGEFEQDAEFTDVVECEHAFETGADGDKVCTKCGYVPDDGAGERPTSGAAPTVTERVQTAEHQPDTSGSAEPASEGSPKAEAEPSPSGPDGEAEEEQTAASAGEVYLLAGDVFNAEGRRPTYKDGVQFSSVGEKAGQKLTIYDLHAPEIAPPEEAPAADDDFPGDRVTPPAEGDDVFAAAFGKMAAATSYLGAKQAMKTLTSTEPYALSSGEQKTGVRLALWKRYVDLCEDKKESGEVWIDFTLMRLFLEFGATSEKQVDDFWAKFDRNTAFKDATEGDQAAMSKLMLATKARLRDR